MGNYCLKYHDPLDESTWEYERCRCCDDKKEPRLATYRCQYTTNGRMVKEAPVEYPDLQKYWRSACGPCYQYVGCDQCMTDQMKPLFTHHPMGWKEHCKCHIDYETIRFPV